MKIHNYGIQIVVLLSITTNLCALDALKKINLQDVAKVVDSVGLGDAQKTINELNKYADQITNAVATIQGSQAVTPVYCPQEVPMVIQSMDYALHEDMEGLIPYIKKYCPILYLHPNEHYLPINAENYFTAPTSSLVIKNNKQPGPVTMQQLYDLKNQYTAVDKNLYIDIAQCTKFGLNPKVHSNASSLTTPAYVITYKDPTKQDTFYIQFIFLYGFNGPFALRIPDIEKDVVKAASDFISKGYVADKASPVLEADVLPLQGAHEGDIEHVTMEFDAKTKKPTRIFYAAHGNDEGSWLDYSSALVTKEDAHPVVYVADHSHACYPQEGTYVRVLGFGNDITEKGKRWTPTWIRLYKDDDKRFNPATMGWMYFPGTIGKRGVSDLAYKSWFKTFGSETGRTYETVQKTFCPKNSTDANCVYKKRFSAAPPGGFDAVSKQIGL